MSVSSVILVKQAAMLFSSSEVSRDFRSRKLQSLLGKTETIQKWRMKLSISGQLIIRHILNFTPFNLSTRGDNV